MYTVDIEMLKEKKLISTGFSFGEISLIIDVPRLASCFSKNEGLILGLLERDKFRELLLNEFRDRVDKNCVNLYKFYIFK